MISHNITVINDPIIVRFNFRLQKNFKSQTRTPVFKKFNLKLFLFTGTGELKFLGTYTY